MLAAVDHSSLTGAVLQEQRRKSNNRGIDRSGAGILAAVAHNRLKVSMLNTAA